MYLSHQFTVVDLHGERHTVSIWRGMSERPTSVGIEFVPVITEYKIDEWSIERVDDTTFRAPSGEILHRVSESESPDRT